MRRTLILLTVLAAAAVASCSDRLGAMQEFAKGTWSLQSRRMPDGKVLTPPRVFGLLQWSPVDSRTAHVTLSVRTRPESGPPTLDHSAATCEVSTSAITRKRHLLVRDGYPSSSKEPIVYYSQERSFKGKVAVEGDAFLISHEEGHTQTYRGDTMTASIPGGFVDTWKRIR